MKTVIDLVYSLFCCICSGIRLFKFVEDDGRDEVYVGECGHTKRVTVR